MGMGKTIMAMSLVLKDKEDSQEAHENDNGGDRSHNKKGKKKQQKTTVANKSVLPAQSKTSKGTLVVCPLVAVIQWQQEIKR